MYNFGQYRFTDRTSLPSELQSSGLGHLGRPPHGGVTGGRLASLSAFCSRWVRNSPQSANPSHLEGAVGLCCKPAFMEVMGRGQISVQGLGGGGVPPNIWMPQR